ncbi:MAG: SusD/RagB family nutrient-binding outer membrane lipoprotein, partial [Bacteroidetes bacterium]|nr:SusD/RagB family nutrient-binding outer membrane lipoprotein [Bacteroidota bacterium]
LLIFSVVFVSCHFEDEDINPNKEIAERLSELLPGAITQGAYNHSALPARASAIFMQYLRGWDSSVVPFTYYRLYPNIFTSYWDSGLYGGILKDGKHIIDLAKEKQQPHYEAIAKILMAQSYGDAAAFFGDIPFSKALFGDDNLYPAYDRQEGVFNGVQQLLDEAIYLFEQTAAGEGSPQNDDLIYNGNAELWIKAAYALKARYLLQLSNRQSEVYAEILEIVQNKSFEDLTEQADFKWGKDIDESNPIATFGVERPGTYIVHEQFVERLREHEDPRRPYFVYLESDYYSDYHYYYEGNDTLHWTQKNASIPLISYVEIKFMEGEALLQTGSADHEIEKALYEGIKASMEQMNMEIAPYEGFIAEHSDLSNYVTPEEKLKHIIDEAYMAYYGFAFQQTWNNYRRTGYPELIPNEYGTNEVNPSGVIPRRFLYPQSEIDYNTDNWQAAVDRQGGALLDVDVWSYE